MGWAHHGPPSPTGVVKHQFFLYVLCTVRQTTCVFIGFLDGATRAKLGITALPPARRLCSEARQQGRLCVLRSHLIRLVRVGG